MGKTKKDKAVQVTAKGQIKMVFEGMAIMQLCQFLYESADLANEYCGLSTGINSANYSIYAKLSICYDLHERLFDKRNVPETLEMKISRTEAIMLWGIFQENQKNYPFLIESFMKLHQKLS